MTKRKSVKQQITEAVLEEIPKTEKIRRYQDSIDQLIFNWWVTGRQEGLRLTESGRMAFELANVEYYDFSFKQEGSTYYSFVSDLSKKINCPYYLGTNKTPDGKNFYLRLYDSKVAMMLNLYGNINEYLASVKIRK